VKGQVLSQIGRNQLLQDLIDQPVVRCVEWIDESNARQFKAILQVLGKQKRTPARCAAAHNIASQNVSPRSRKIVILSTFYR